MYCDPWFYWNRYKWYVYIQIFKQALEILIPVFKNRLIPAQIQHIIYCKEKIDIIIVKLRTPLGMLMLRHHHQSRSWVGTQQAPNQTLFSSTANIYRPESAEKCVESLVSFNHPWNFQSIFSSPDTRTACHKQKRIAIASAQLFMKEFDWAHIDKRQSATMIDTDTRTARAPLAHA